MTFLANLARYWPFCLRRTVDLMRIRLNAEVRAKHEAQRQLADALAKVERWRMFLSMAGIRVGKERVR